MWAGARRGGGAGEKGERQSVGWNGFKLNFFNIPHKPAHCGAPFFLSV